MIGPHRQYHVTTSKGQVLVRNRRFLRRRTPTSILEGIPRETTEYPADHRSGSHNSAINSRVTASKEVKSHKETDAATSGRPYMELRTF